MRFTKLHGCGNAYIYIDGRSERVDDPVQLARDISDARTGLGSDGLFLLHGSDVADVRAEMFNADGSRIALCGNGIRCVGKYVIEQRCRSKEASRQGVPQVFRPGEEPPMLQAVFQRTTNAMIQQTGIVPNIHALRVETIAGVKQLWCYEQNGVVKVVTADLGPASLQLADMNCTLDGDTAIDREVTAGDKPYRLTLVSTGSLHAIVFLEDIDQVDLDREGPALEHCDVFPDRVNAHFVQVLSPNHLRMRIWERGSGATRGCGTGACAAVAAGLVGGRSGASCLVDQPGGRQYVDISDTTCLTGETLHVCGGEWRPETRVGESS